MVCTKITRQRDGWHKNNWPKGWMDGGELNGRHKNTLPKGWMKGELFNSINRNILDIKLKLVKTQVKSRVTVQSVEHFVE